MPKANGRQVCACQSSEEENERRRRVHSMSRNPQAGTARWTVSWSKTASRGSRGQMEKVVSQHSKETRAECKRASSSREEERRNGRLCQRPVSATRALPFPRSTAGAYASDLQPTQTAHPVGWPRAASGLPTLCTISNCTVRLRPLITQDMPIAKSWRIFCAAERAIGQR